MVSPINEAASLSINAEITKKNPKSPTPNSGDITQFGAAEPVSLKSKVSYGSTEIKKSDTEDSDQGKIKKERGEVRKSELSNGTLTVNVYDHSGKLLRKIPPGYLPVGEQQFDVTV